MNRNRCRSAQRCDLAGRPVAEDRGGEALTRLALEPDDLGARCGASTLGSASMRSIRYFDMDASSPSPRTTRWRCFDLRRQEHHRLSGRIAAADQRDLLAGAELRLDGRRPVGDAGAFEVGEIVDAAAGGSARPRRSPRSAPATPCRRRVRASANGRRRRAAAAVELRHLQPEWRSRRRISAPG